MINFKKIALKVFRVLKGNDYSIELYSEDGMETVDPEQTRRFFVKSPNIMVTIDDTNQALVVNTGSGDSIEEMQSVIEQLKSIANHNMLNFDLHNIGKEINPKETSYQSVDVTESKMYGSTKSSYQMIENVKLIVRHKSHIDEEKRGCRSKHIQRIFLEHDGEKVRLDHKNLNGARAMARHLGRGGQVGDPIWEHIQETTTKLIKLREFLKYVRSNGLLNEKTTDTIKLVRENVANLNLELKQLASSRSYKTSISRISEQQATLEVGNGDIDVKDQFTVKYFDEQFENLLPHIGNLIQEDNMNKSKIQEASENVIKLSKNSPLEENILEFNSPSTKIGNKIVVLSARILENDQLAAYVCKLGNKMIAEEALSEFEKKIVSNVFKNSVVPQVKAKTSMLGESMQSFEKSLEKHSFSYLIESMREEQTQQVDEGWFDKIVDFFSKDKNLEQVAKELADTGARLKEIEAHLKKHGLLEYSSDSEHTALTTNFAEAIKRYEAARKGLGLVNKLKDKESKRKNGSRVMTNMNKLRSLVKKMNAELEAGMQPKRRKYTW